MGNEGDDWIEKGTSDGAPGDNFDPLGNDTVIGNDVFLGGGENDKFNAEGGDDIMVGSAGMGDRYIGGSGFDWATFKDDQMGVTIDFSDRFFDQPLVPGSGASALARFDIVEGLSGSAFADVLNGDDEDATSLPTAGATGSVLTNIGLISGLQGLLGAGVTFFDGGNIILGGAGSDHIMGRGGNDLIDGDAWLNVRIWVDANNNSTEDAGDRSFDSMVPLAPFMLAGTYNPGQLQLSAKSSMRRARTSIPPCTRAIGTTTPSSTSATLSRSATTSDSREPIRSSISSGCSSRIRRSCSAALITSRKARSTSVTRPPWRVRR